MKSFFVLILAALFFQTSVWAQSPTNAQYTSTNKKAIALYEKAEGFIHNRMYNEAIPLLKESVAKDPMFAEAYFKLGSVYRVLADVDNSKIYYKKGAEVKPDYKPFGVAYFQTAEYYFNEGDYVNAKKYFDMVLRMNPNDKKALEMSPKYIAKCDFALNIMKTPLDFKPVLMPANVNSFFIHGYPVLTADNSTLIYTKRSGPRLSDDEDIVMCTWTNGAWSAPVSISPNIQSEFNEGACTMSADGTVLVFASCNRKDGYGACDLYISYKKGTDWSVPVNMGTKVNSNVWDSEPSLSADGKTLYFSSERGGGMGKEDIWVTKMGENGEWMQAVNLGKPVNTEGREVSPFIHANGQTLYFSSTYHLGLGGFDIFTTTKTQEGWSTPKNVGYPINTYENEATAFITADGSKGYYSVYEKKDMMTTKALLYEFTVPKELKEENQSTYAKGTVYDSQTKQKIGANLELIDLSNGEVIQSVSSDAVNGNYILVLTEGKEYALYVTKENYLFKSVFFDYKNPSSFDPLALDVYLDPVKAGNKVVMNNVFFASNSYEIDPRSKTELNKIILFMKKNPSVKIEFGAHTDDVGSDQANMALSQNRAKAVYDYLVKSGIEAPRMKYKGYGETSPVAPNTTEENRQKNRRIEFKVL